MKSFSKSRNELLKARVVNFNGNIDKAADVTVFAVGFSFSSVFESSMPNTDVIEELREKKEGGPFFLLVKRKHYSTVCMLLMSTLPGVHTTCARPISQSRST